MKDALRVNDIYWAIEGEGTFIGSPQVFIRLQGCRVGCINCDSKETWSFKHPLTPISEIVEETLKKLNGANRVLITGGDPLDPDHREGLLSLISELRKRKLHVSLEASGQRFDQEIFEAIDFISCDIKTPSTSVQQDLAVLKNLYQFNEDKFQIKGVVFDQSDFDFIANAQKEVSPNCKKPWVLTPCFEPGDSQSAYTQRVKKIYSYVFESERNFRVIAQQHKWIYGPDRTSV